MALWFDSAFRGGSILLATNFLFFSFVDPVIRTLTMKPFKGNYDNLYIMMAYVFEVLIRLLVYFASILQFVLLMTGASRYCT